MSRGFASPRPAARVARVWFACYARDNDDEPLSIERHEIPAVPGQDIARLAVIRGRRLLEDPAVHEVIAHRGPNPEPDRGEDVLARVCREPFRGSSRLGGAG